MITSRDEQLPNSKNYESQWIWTNFHNVSILWPVSKNIETKKNELKLTIYIIKQMGNKYLSNTQQKMSNNGTMMVKPRRMNKTFHFQSLHVIIIFFLGRKVQSFDCFSFYIVTFSIIIASIEDMENKIILSNQPCQLMT